MRVAIVGAGGVGGLYCGLLARAGTEVAILARGAQLAAIRAHGISVDSPLGSFTVRPTNVSDDPAALGPAEGVLVCVKTWQVAEIAPRLAPLVAAGGVVVPLQNGVEAASQLASALGEERVAGGITHVLAWTSWPGQVKHVGNVPRITMGERGAHAGRPSPRLEALAAAIRGAGVDARLVDDIEGATWEKFLLIEPWGSVSAVARAPLGVVRSVPETRELLERAMREVVEVARARGVRLTENAMETALHWIDTAPAKATASMQRDLGGERPSELREQTGAVVRLGREAGAPVPVHENLYAALLPQELAARGETARFERS